MIPYICQDLPQKQKDALASAQKVPLLYTNVALRDWKSFQKLNTNAVYAPGCYHTRMGLDLAVSIGGYECARKPEEPIVVHMMQRRRAGRWPPGARAAHRLGAVELFTTTFETMERKIREQLARTLEAGGFDPARDIAAITVNRWPHGYAYEYNSLWDTFWLEGGETPCEVARKTFGRIAIANADAGAYAYTDEAINQAWRAVGAGVEESNSRRLCLQRGTYGSWRPWGPASLPPGAPKRGTVLSCGVNAVVMCQAVHCVRRHSARITPKKIPPRAAAPLARRGAETAQSARRRLIP